MSGHRADEIALWTAFPNPHNTPRDAGIALGMPRKRVDYLCLKWSRQRIYEYGVTCDLGWKLADRLRGDT